MNERIESIITAMNFIADNFMTGYRTDINHDKIFMLEEKPIEFIWIMRDWGTHVINPQWRENHFKPLLSYFSPKETPNSNWTKECRFFGVYLYKDKNRIVELNNHQEMVKTFTKMRDNARNYPIQTKALQNQIY